jgi:ligand-binding sensor domain-containing protein
MIRWLLLCLLGGTGLYAQLRQPSFLQTTTDNGLPANEVYSVLQDRYGMIWLGTDAGLVKHCGAYFKVLRNAGQRSAELTGLVAGRSGRVYGYNFNKQLFFAENDSLHLLRNFTCNVSSTIADTAGFLWVTTDSGMFRYQESTARWENLFSPAQSNLAKNGCLDARQHVWCSEGNYVTEYWPLGKKKYPIDMPKGQILVLGNYCIVPSGGDVWML